MKLLLKNWEQYTEIVSSFDKIHSVSPMYEGSSNAYIRFHKSATIEELCAFTKKLALSGAQWEVVL